jgi:hypothetical protein
MMKPEDKVVSLEIAIELHKLKITEGIRTYWVYVRREDPNTNWFGEWELIRFEDVMEWLWNNVPDFIDYRGGLIHQELKAPDLAELGELLPKGIKHTTLDTKDLLNPDYIASSIISYFKMNQT